jgi:hypothetical protein
MSLDDPDRVACWVAVFVVAAAFVLAVRPGPRVRRPWLTLAVFVGVPTGAGVAAYLLVGWYVRTEPPARVPVAVALLLGSWLQAGLYESVIARLGSAVRLFASIGLTFAVMLYGPLVTFSGAAWVSANSPVNLLPSAQPGRGAVITLVFLLFLAPPVIAGMFADDPR